MNRSVHEVTFQAARLKEPSYRPTTDSVAETIVQEATKKAKKVVPSVAEEKPTASDVVWTQEQQKLLETAIVKYPKTTAGDRWQKIANSVPGRTKEECLTRYKYLVQKVKEQKQKEATNQQQENDAQTEKSKQNDANDRIESIDSQEETVNAADEYEPEPEPEPVAKKSGGKPRNKRKERKKRMEFSSDEDDYYNDE